MAVYMIFKYSKRFRFAPSFNNDIPDVQISFFCSKVAYYNRKVSFLPGKRKKKLCKIKSRLRIIAKYRNICKKMPISFAVSSNRKCVVQIFSNFSCMFLNPNNFSNLNSNCSFKFLGIRNLQEQVKKAFCLPKIVLTFHCLNKFFDH